MRVLVCIDDTDNLESPGTGKLASALAGEIERKGWGRAAFITRHQLFVHPDIAYTSHNSAMCFAAELTPEGRDRLAGYAGEFLERHGAPGSDPGLCILAPAELADADSLCAFGRAAKSQVLTKQDAYRLARGQGIHLSEHGGTGLGVVGALAGVALRLGGNDGRLRGRLAIDAPDGTLSVAALMTHPLIGGVQTVEGEPLAAYERVRLGDRIKSVLRESRPVLLVVPRQIDAPTGARWQTCPDEILRRY